MHIEDAVIFLHILDAETFMHILDAVIFMHTVDAAIFMHVLNAVIFMSAVRQRHKTMVLRRDRGGQAPPCPRRNCPPRHIQDLHYAKPWFCAANKSSGHKSMIHGWISTPALRQKTRIGHT